MTTEQFDQLADQFYRETGMIAPGKDAPAAVGEWPSGEDRYHGWVKWNAVREARIERTREIVKWLAVESTSDAWVDHWPMDDVLREVVSMIRSRYPEAFTEPPSPPPSIRR